MCSGGKLSSLSPAERAARWTRCSSVPRHRRGARVLRSSSSSAPPRGQPPSRPPVSVLHALGGWRADAGAYARTRRGARRGFQVRGRGLRHERPTTLAWQRPIPLQRPRRGRRPSVSETERHEFGLLRGGRAGSTRALLRVTPAHTQHSTHARHARTHINHVDAHSRTHVREYYLT